MIVCGWQRQYYLYHIRIPGFANMENLLNLLKWYKNKSIVWYLKPSERTCSISNTPDKSWGGAMSLAFPKLIKKEYCL